MCGICGIALRNGAVDQEDIHRMNSMLCHRGPDNEGYYIGSSIGLGHRRLSIIDLVTGQQPMFNERRNLCIVFNGEIYNYRVLRDELLTRGHEFSTKSDTEVIIHLYEDRGVECLHSLRGMFAFAIWNEDTKELFLARDRVGKKPLYYAVIPRGILFASEMKSLMVHPWISREIDFEGLIGFLGNKYVPEPRTILRDVSKLEAGHFLSWKNGQTTIRRYWNLAYEPKLPISEEEAIEEIRHRLDEAVKVRLESDVPLGCLLSGGVDSSSVVAFMRRHVGGDLKTFSIGFEEEEYNELPLARHVAEKFETQHEELIVKPNAVDILPRLVWHFDEPYADSSALATYYVAEMTRRSVTVALNGDGGDESFLGYTRYIPSNEIDVMSKWRRIPRFLRRLVVQPAASGAFHLFPLSPLLQRLYFGNSFSLLGPQEVYIRGMTLFHDQMGKLLCGPAIPRNLWENNTTSSLLSYMENGSTLSYADQIVRTDVHTYLPGDLLVKMDRMTMAHSLEARSPFLDHTIMEYAAILPLAIKFKDSTLKYILKKALRGIVPDEILDGRKHGFSVPIVRWFKRELKQFSEDVLLSPEMYRRGFLNQRYVRQLLREHQSERRAYHHHIWALLNFELWCKTFLDRASIESGPISL
jgi:asparagine synthase (glutamine-hydrolysing)